jgi:hypothetical protein
MGLIWTVGQTGLSDTNAHLCEFFSRYFPDISENCPASDWIVTIAGYLFFVAVAIIVLDTFWIIFTWVSRKPRSTAASEQVKSLSYFYSTSHQLLSRISMLPENVSDDDYNNLQHDIDKWSQTLETYIDQHLGVAEKSRLMESSGPLPFNPETGYREKIAIDRARTLFALTVVRKNLLSLIDRLNAH